MNRNTIKPVILLIGAAILIGSCSMGTGFSDTEEVARDAAEAQVVLRAISTGISVAEEDDVTSRSINATAGDGSVDLTTPDTAWTDISGVAPTVGATATSGVINDFYGATANKAQFTMTVVSTSPNVYSIDLKVYPVLIYDVLYQQEKYYVEGDDWTTYDASDVATANTFTSIWVYYADGTKGRVTINNSSSLDSNEVYDSADMTVATSVFGSQSELDYYTVDALPAITGSSGNDATFSINTSTNVTKSNLSFDEWYAEFDESGETVAYSLQTGEDKYQEYVTRSSSNLDTGEFHMVSLAQAASTKNWSNTVLDQEDVTLDGSGIRTVSYTQKIWYLTTSGVLSASSTLRDEAHQLIQIDLTETSAGSASYTGTLDVYWGNNGNSYNLSITSQLDGSVSMDMTWGSNISRSADSLDIDLSELSSEISFDIPNSSATFTGMYQRGALVGTYSIGNRSIEVEILPDGIVVGSDSYSNADLF